MHFKQLEDGLIQAEVNSRLGSDSEIIKTYAEGNGRLDAVSNALKKAYGFDYKLVTYQEHALTQSSKSLAIAYVGVQNPDGTFGWGAGTDSDIIRASIDALVTSINNR